MGVTVEHSNLLLLPFKKLYKQKKKQTINACFFQNGSSSWARTSDIMINSHALCQLSYRGISLLLSLTFSLNTKDNDFCRYLQHSSFRQLSTFPGSHPPSIIDVKELNFCVRHGNRWFLLAIVTGSSLLRSYPPKLNNITSQCAFSLISYLSRS